MEARRTASPALSRRRSAARCRESRSALDPLALEPVGHRAVGALRQVRAALATGAPRAVEDAVELAARRADIASPPRRHDRDQLGHVGHARETPGGTTTTSPGGTTMTRWPRRRSAQSAHLASMSRRPRRSVSCPRSRDPRHACSRRIREALGSENRGGARSPAEAFVGGDGERVLLLLLGGDIRVGGASRGKRIRAPSPSCFTREPRRLHGGRPSTRVCARPRSAMAEGFAVRVGAVGLRVGQRSPSLMKACGGSGRVVGRQRGGHFDTTRCRVRPAREVPCRPRERCAPRSSLRARAGARAPRRACRRRRRRCERGGARGAREDHADATVEKRRAGGRRRTTRRRSPPPARRHVRQERPSGAGR